jgi:hypothetical protein
VRVGETRIGRRDQHITSQRDLDAAGDGQPVDRTDHGAAEALQRRDDIVLVRAGGGYARRVPLVEIEPHREGTASAGQYQHPDLRFGLERIDRACNLLAHPDRQRIELVGAVQHQRREALVRSLDEDGFESHGSQGPRNTARRTQPDPAGCFNPRRSRR